MEGKTFLYKKALIRIIFTYDLHELFKRTLDHVLEKETIIKEMISENMLKYDFFNIYTKLLFKDFRASSS